MQHSRTRPLMRGFTQICSVLEQDDTFVPWYSVFYVVIMHHWRIESSHRQQLNRFGPIHKHVWLLSTTVLNHSILYDKFISPSFCVPLRTRLNCFSRLCPRHAPLSSWLGRMDCFCATDTRYDYSLYMSLCRQKMACTSLSAGSARAF